METKCSPGPWEAHKGIVVRGDQREFAVAYTSDYFTHRNGLPAWPEAEANARLMAAALDLLDVAKDVVEKAVLYANSDRELNALIEKAEAAIAKATTDPISA